MVSTSNADFQLWKQITAVFEQRYVKEELTCCKRYTWLTTKACITVQVLLDSTDVMFTYCGGTTVNSKYIRGLKENDMVKPT